MDREVKKLRDMLTPKFSELVCNGYWYRCVMDRRKRKRERVLCLCMFFTQWKEREVRYHESGHSPSSGCCGFLTSFCCVWSCLINPVCVCVFSSPEMDFLLAAINKSQELIDGTVDYKLYKGSMILLGRSSPSSLYDKVRRTLYLSSFSPFSFLRFFLRFRVPLHTASETHKDGEKCILL